MRYSEYPELAAIQKLLEAHPSCCQGKATLCEEICLCDCHKKSDAGIAEPTSSTSPASTTPAIDQTAATAA